MGQSSSNSLIPKNYKELERLGAGSFGVVVKCKKKDTKEIVELMISQRDNMDGELAVMSFFKQNNLDKWNIVRFIGPVTLTNNCTALAFESLGMTLREHVNATHGPNVCDIRSVVQQVASALHALESVKVIHADITSDNIMLVDRKVQPLRVKLIDFGMSLPSSSVKLGLFRQMKLFRAPEIFLGLPFSESIDMWSLGVVLARLVLGRLIFPGVTDYNLRHIVDLLGVPPDHLLAAGMFSNKYFVREYFGKWRLKTYEEFWSPRQVPDGVRVYRINYPYCLEMSPMNAVNAADREECVDLLKAMLRMESTERITPSQVLAHPFITRGNLQPSSDSIREAAGQPPQTPYSTSMEYKNWVGYDSECHEPAAVQIPPGVMLVQPAPPECRLALAEDNRQGETSRIREASAPPPQTPSVSTSMEYKSCPLGLLEELSKNSSVELLAHPSKGPDMQQEDTKSTDTMSVPQKRKKMKRKNPFKRLWAWAKETFTSSSSVDAES